MSRKSRAQDFWSKISITDSCWEWTGKTNEWGYGRLAYQGRLVLAHRLSLHLWTGFDLRAREQVQHLCNNPKCVRPNHLKSGTPKENAEYMAMCGRANKPIGLRNPKCKLTENDVHYIRTSCLSRRALSEKFGVSLATVNDILRNRTWKHLL